MTIEELNQKKDFLYNQLHNAYTGGFADSSYYGKLYLKDGKSGGSFINEVIALSKPVYPLGLLELKAKLQETISITNSMLDQCKVCCCQGKFGISKKNLKYMRDTSAAILSEVSNRIPLIQKEYLEVLKVIDQYVDQSVEIAQYQSVQAQTNIDVAESKKIVAENKAARFKEILTVYVIPVLIVVAGVIFYVKRK